MLWDVIIALAQAGVTLGTAYLGIRVTIHTVAAGGRLGATTKLGSCFLCSRYNRADVKWDHFSPRLGFAYQLNNKTVLQGGFSVNFLNGGAYEYGTSKVAVDYGNLLNGSVNIQTNNSNIPAYGFWDGNPLIAPPPLPFGPSVGNGQTIHEFNETMVSRLT
jgi:TonB dependent receptor